MANRLAIGLMLATACGPPVEEGLFFPTWDAGGDAPSGIVQGVLVEKDRCLFLEDNGRRTLVIWEAASGSRTRRSLMRCLPDAGYALIYEVEAGLIERGVITP